MSAPLLDVEFLKPMSINGRKPYTKYEISVTSSLHSLSWIVFKRYSDFVNLNDALITLIEANPKLQPANIILGTLPRRRIFGGMNEDVVQERKRKLQLYTKNVLKYKSLCHQDIVLEFLNVPEEVKMMMDTLKNYYRQNKYDQHNKYNNNIQRLEELPNKHENINEQQVNTLLNKLYYQKNRSDGIKYFENWYFENGYGHGYKFNPHLIRKLLIGYDKYIGLMQSCKHINTKPSSKTALRLLVKLFDIERNKYARIFINVFINLNPEIYREMDLHRHIVDYINDDAFEIICIFINYLPHLNYKMYVNSQEAFYQFLEWNTIQSNSYVVGELYNVDKQEIDEKQIKHSVFDYNIYKNNPKNLINLSNIIFTKYCEFMYENDDNYRPIPKINEKYNQISLNVGIQKDFKNNHWKIKISFILNIDANILYNFLKTSYIGNENENENDCESYGWDKKLINRTIEEKLTDNEYIMHETYKSYNSPYRFRDFVVLRTFRGSDHDNINQLYQNKKYFIAFSSITNYNNLTFKKDNNDSTDCTRCIMFPSGFEITQYGNNKSYITYRLHMTEEGINIINADLLGECDELFQSFIRIHSLITINHIDHKVSSMLSDQIIQQQMQS